MYLVHHGILGQKWGVRRFQNPDGSLTAEGKRHVANYKEANARSEKVMTEMDKVIKSDKRLKSDLVSASMVDDFDLFEYLARDYGLDMTNYNQAYKNEQEFYRDNIDSIAIGRKITKKILNK